MGWKIWLCAFPKGRLLLLLSEKEKRESDVLWYCSIKDELKEYALCQVFT